MLNTSATATETTSFQEILVAKNAIQLNNLESGKYKLEIQSIVRECEDEIGSNSKTYYEEIITVPNREDLFVVEGPYIDTNLCQGEAGKISLQVFDNQQAGLTFYYNGAIISIDEEASNVVEGVFKLNIPEPVASSNLIITNAEGCQISERIILTEIGVPSFEYSSPSLQLEGQVKAREELTFTNTSEQPYTYSEWIFGDGTRETVSRRAGTVSPVYHTYGISGSYLATLRNYNRLGCFKEITQRIVVGKGYNIMVPNAFSPNGDSINDAFRALFSGFIRVNFSIYDNFGNILYAESIAKPNPDLPQGIELNGWDGINATSSTSYIYRFEGFTSNEENPVVRSGTFILLR